mgnify:CR=1 FL=1
MKRVLVVEDDRAIRVGVRGALVSEGLRVIEAKDGDEGLALARAERFDLIVLDVMLPGRSGFEMRISSRRTDRRPTVSRVKRPVPTYSHVLLPSRPLDMPRCSIRRRTPTWATALWWTFRVRAIRSAEPRSWWSSCGPGCDRTGTRR